MANVQNLHTELQSFCGDNLGFAIHKRFILDLYKKSIQNFANLNLANQFIQRQAIFDKYHLSFGVDIDYSGTNVELSYNNDTGYNEVAVLNLIIKFKVSSTYTDETTGNVVDLGLVSTTTINFEKLIANFTLDNHELRLVPQTFILKNTAPTSNPNTVSSPQKQDILVNQMHIDPAVYDIKEQAIILIAVEELAKAFTEAVTFPDFYNMLVGFKFNEGGILGAERGKDFFFFSAPGIINLLQCPYENSKGEVVVKASASANTSTTTAANTNNVSVNISSDKDPWDEYVNHIERTTEISRHDLFVYIPNKSYKIPFEGIIKPAVNFSDRGGIGPIYWRWTAAAALKSLGITIGSTGGAPSVVLSAPIEVQGQAGAGIKIGCIRYEALGAMCDGEIDPLDIEFTISIDLKVPSIIFVSRIKQVEGKKFSFRTFPELKFPISQILDFLLGRIAEVVAKSQTGKILNTTRVTLADFTIFKDISGVANNLAYYQDDQGNFTAGVAFRK